MYAAVASVTRVRVVPRQRDGRTGWRSFAGHEQLCEFDFQPSSEPDQGHERDVDLTGFDLLQVLEIYSCSFGRVLQSPTMLVSKLPNAQAKRADLLPIPARFLDGTGRTFVAGSARHPQNVV